MAPSWMSHFRTASWWRHADPSKSIIAYWSKSQRIRQAEYRKKQKLMLENKNNVTSRDSNAVDKNRIDKEKEKNISSHKKLSKLDDIKIKINKLEISDKLKHSLIEFAEYRKEIKKEVTFRSIKMTVKNLLDNKKYTSEEHLISSIENSISQGYTGIFPVEEKNNKINNKSADINLTDVV